MSCMHTLYTEMFTGLTLPLYFTFPFKNVIIFKKIWVFDQQPKLLDWIDRIHPKENQEEDKLHGWVGTATVILLKIARPWYFSQEMKPQLSSRWYIFCTYQRVILLQIFLLFWMPIWVKLVIWRGNLGFLSFLNWSHRRSIWDPRVGNGQYWCTLHPRIPLYFSYRMWRKASSPHLKNSCEESN